jgi:pyruvate kinase
MTLDKTLRASRIVCTLGPASESLPVLEAIIRAGMNIARLNFSPLDARMVRLPFYRICRAIRSGSESS